MRAVAIALLVAVIVPIVGYFGLDLFLFQPHRAAIEQIVQSADPENRNLSADASQLLLFNLRNDSSQWSTRLLLDRLGFQPRNHVNWMIVRAFWTSFVQLHIPERDRLTIIASLSPTGANRRGMNETSKDIFGKPLSQLSLKKAATIISLMKSSGLDKQPARLAGQRDRLLTAYDESIGKH